MASNKRHTNVRFATVSVNSTDCWVVNPIFQRLWRYQMYGHGMYRKRSSCLTDYNGCMTWYGLANIGSNSSNCLVGVVEPELCW